MLLYKDLGAFANIYSWHSRSYEAERFVWNGAALLCKFRKTVSTAVSKYYYFVSHADVIYLGYVYHRLIHTDPSYYGALASSYRKLNSALITRAQKTVCISYGYGCYLHILSGNILTAIADRVTCFYCFDI